MLQAKTVQPKPGTEEKGQIVQTETPVHHSNVMHWSKEQKVRSRIRQQCVPSCHRCLLGSKCALKLSSICVEGMSWYMMFSHCVISLLSDLNLGCLPILLRKAAASSISE